MSEIETDDCSEANLETGTYQTTFDSRIEPVSTVVISAVSTALEEEAIEMPPLYNAIDPDALDAVFQPVHTGSPRDDRHLQFTFNGCQVTVQSDGIVVVEPFTRKTI